MRAARRLCSVLVALMMLAATCGSALAKNSAEVGTGGQTGVERPNNASTSGGVSGSNNSGSGGGGGSTSTVIPVSLGGIPFTNNFSDEDALADWETDYWDAAVFEVTEEGKLAIGVDGTGARSERASYTDKKYDLQGKIYPCGADSYRWEISADITITDELLASKTPVRSELATAAMEMEEDGRTQLMLGFKRGAKNDGDQDAQEVGAVETEEEKFANVWRYWDFKENAFVVSDTAVTAGVHTLKIRTVGRDISYLVDGKEIGKASLAELGIPQGVGLYAYNFGLDAAYEGYTVLWDNVSAEVLPEETGSAAYIENGEGEKVWHFSVQEALDAAKNGDTITVLAGAHDEELTLAGKAVTLKGEEKDGQTAEISTLTVNGDTDGLKLENLTFTGTKADAAGDKVSLNLTAVRGTSKNVTVTGCAFSASASGGTDVAVSGTGVSGLTVDHCTFEGYTYAVRLDAANADTISKTAAVTSCTFKNISGGLRFIDVDNAAVKECVFEKSNGICLEKKATDVGCKNVKINDNIFRSVPSRGEGFAVKAEEDEIAGYTGRVNLSDNFWGEGNAPKKMIIGYDSENMNYYPYYLDESFKTAVTAEIRSVNLDQKSIKIYVGKSYTLEATIKPDGASASTVTWSSSDEDVATVSQKGVVKGKKAGTATIQAEVDGKYDTCKVTVERRPASSAGDNSGSSGNNKNNGGSYIPNNNNNNNSSDKTDTTGAFSDVKTNDWYYDSVSKAVKKGLFSGVTKNTFEPNARMTRAMLVTVLWRMDGSPAAGEAGFTDVASGEWYAAAVAWASANGIVNGVTDDQFAPQNPITREQIAAMANRFASYKGLSLNAEQEEIAFSDGGEISDYAKDAVKAMQKAGIINGRGDGSFAPQGIATRAECAKILTMLSEK